MGEETRSFIAGLIYHILADSLEYKPHLIWRVPCLRHDGEEERFQRSLGQDAAPVYLLLDGRDQSVRSRILITAGAEQHPSTDVDLRVLMFCGRPSVQSSMAQVASTNVRYGVADLLM